MKNWATPLAVGAFTISAVTGLLIFFDLELGIVEPVHKWLSWLLVTGVILHLISNWKQFTGYFSKKPAVVNHWRSTHRHDCVCVTDIR